MANSWRNNFTITLITESSSYSSTSDITSDVQAIPRFTDTGGDEINSAQIVLNAKNGKFLTASPILADYDRIRIEGQDEDGNNYDRIFEIAPKPDTIIPSEDQSGTLVTLNLLGIEYHVQNINYLKTHYFENPFNVVKDIGDSYNSNKGTKQPTINNHDVAYNTGTLLGNDAPDWIIGMFPWGQTPKSHWQRLSEMREFMASSVLNGGAFDFFLMGFDTHQSDFNRIDLRFASLGGTPSSSLEVIDGTDRGTGKINHGETEGGYSPPTGSLVIGWFSDEHGSLPVDFSRFISAEQTFEFRPEWDSSKEYKIDARVKYEGNVYKRENTDVTGPGTPPTSDADWVLVDQGDEYGDSIQMSPWTDDKAVLWGNGFTHPDYLVSPTESGSAWATSTAYAIGDTVQNTLYYVCKVAHTSSASDEPGVGANWEDFWHRTSWASGVAFVSNDIVLHNSVEYRCIDGHTSGASTEPGTGASWETKWVIIENTKLGQDADNYLTRIPDSNLVIFDDAFFRTWVNYKTTNPVNIPSQYLYAGTTLYRGFRVLCDGTGAGDFAGVDKNNVDYDNSVVEYDGSEWVVKYKATSAEDTMEVINLHEGINYEWNNGAGTWDSLIAADLGNECVHPFDALYNTEGVDERPQDDNWTTNKYSAVEMISHWSTLAQRLISVPVGMNQEYYKKFAGVFFWFPYPLSTYNGISEGVGELFGGTTSTGQEPATLDTENMHLTPKGLRGFNQTDSESFGPINSLDFFLKFHYSTSGDDATLINEGNFKFRCAVGDTSDNVKVQDFTIPFNNVKHPVNLPLSGFKQYRARKPRYAGFSEFIPPKDIEVLDKFEWRNVKWIAIHWLDVYDEFGRFYPEQRDADILGTLKNIPKLIGEHVRLQVDAFRFRKPLLKITSTVSDRNLEVIPVKDNNVINYDQANHITYDQLEKEKFKHRGFDIDTSGHFGVRYGEQFYYKNSRVVNENDGTSNQILLVANRIEHSITNRGFRTRFLSAKRFSS